MLGRLMLATSCVALGAAPALAQQASAPAPPTTAKPAKPVTVEEITVTASSTVTQTRIDRRVYAVANDLQSTTGSVSDVLKNVPSVDVDSQGNVSLRGDTNVQILIDGQPSTLMTPANRAAALEQMSAGSIERVEVITNPSAQYKPDGSSGVINIITKRNRKPGRSGSATAGWGSEGRYNLGVTGAFNAGALSLNGGLSLRHDVRKRLAEDDRSRLDAGSGQWLKSHQDLVNETRRMSPVLTGGLDYDLDKQDRLSGSFSWNNRTGNPRLFEHDLAFDASGAPTSDYRRASTGGEHEINTNAQLRWRHSFGEDHSLDLSLQQGDSNEHQARTYVNTFAVPVTPRTSDEVKLHGDERVRELSATYERPFPGEGRLAAGYDLERDDNDYDNYGGTIDLVSGVHTPDPSLTNHFLYGQSIHALYLTTEKPFGKWTVMGGLRFEAVLIDTDQRTTHVQNHIRYNRLYPTLHLQYALSDAQTLRASYSHRVVRPDPEDLNPYPVFADAFNYRAGNPLLMPQETHSLEAGWQYSDHGTSWVATAYLRKSTNGITDVSRYVTPTVLLTTKENLGRSTNGGLELSGAGKLNPRLSYSLNANLFYSRIDASNLGFTGTRSMVSGSGKASLDWKPTGKDSFQFSGVYGGRRLTAQGERVSSAALNLGYRRDLPGDAAIVFTVADVFDSQHDRNIVDLPTLKDNYTRRQLGRVTWIGFTKRFGGGKKPAEDKFDYNN